MTGLLVSVRSAAEAELALAGGADVIDVKEPRRGALGPADPEVWSGVRRVLGKRAMTSAALGELLSPEILELAAAADGLTLAKIGLAGCHCHCGWINRWFDVLRSLPPAVHPVPVAYADWSAADAPSPSVALALAAQSPAKLLLVDTFDKSHGGLLDHWNLGSIAELLRTARQSRVRLTLAGSLDKTAIAKLLPLAPAFVGVRGAVCRGGRDGSLELALVKSLSAIVRRFNQKAAG
jgi:uncharacterized protein (UPF0264 family)